MWSKLGWTVELRDRVQKRRLLGLSNRFNVVNVIENTKVESYGSRSSLPSLVWRNGWKNWHIWRARTRSYPKRIYIYCPKEKTERFQRIERCRNLVKLGLEKTRWSQHRVYRMQYLNPWKFIIKEWLIKKCHSLSFQHSNWW